MKKILIMKISILFIFIALFSCSGTKVQFPKVEKGVLDLRSKSDKAISHLLNEPIALDGEWEFYWKEFYTSEDFANPAKQEEIEKKREWINVPFTIRNREGIKKSGVGYATYRMVLKGEKLKDLSHIYLEL